MAVRKWSSKLHVHSLVVLRSATHIVLLVVSLSNRHTCTVALKVSHHAPVLTPHVPNVNL